MEPCETCGSLNGKQHVERLKNGGVCICGHEYLAKHLDELVPPTNRVGWPDEERGYCIRGRLEILPAKGSFLCSCQFKVENLSQVVMPVPDHPDMGGWHAMLAKSLDRKSATFALDRGDRTDDEMREAATLAYSGPVELGADPVWTPARIAAVLEALDRDAAGKLIDALTQRFFPDGRDA